MRWRARTSFNSPAGLSKSALGPWPAHRKQRSCDLDIDRRPGHIVAKSSAWASASAGLAIRQPAAHEDATSKPASADSSRLVELYESLECEVCCAVVEVCAEEGAALQHGSPVIALQIGKAVQNRSSRCRIGFTSPLRVCRHEIANGGQARSRRTAVEGQSHRSFARVEYVNV